MGMIMDESDFEGTLVLERLAEIGKVDDFFEAIDSDDFGKATSLMKRANIDLKTISKVLKMMGEAQGEH
jgi:hypothetical protein